MALSTLSASFTSQINVNGSVPQTGYANGLGSQNTVQKNSVYTTSASNTASYGADEAYNLLISIAGSGTTTINLQSFTDIAGQTASVARLKAYRFQLLAATETSGDGTQGTACSAVVVGNAGSNAYLMNLGGTTPTFTVNNGSVVAYADGTGTGMGTVDSTHKNILITNSDSVNAAKLLVTLVGAST